MNTCGCNKMSTIYVTHIAWEKLALSGIFFVNL